MSKTIYYLGAGASYGSRDNKGRILEGLPVVSEIPTQFDEFRKFIENTEIQDNVTYTLWGHLAAIGKDLKSEKQYLLEAIVSLQAKIKEHATIDTFARKLYLIGDEQTFIKLKTVLCVFFLWEQLIHKPDNRYDTFLANVLEAKTLALPKEISIISWNYDSQIEIAYCSYRRNPGLSIFEKNIEGDWPNLPSCGRIFKVNGSATFMDRSVIPFIMEEKELLLALQLIRYFSFSLSDTSSLGFHMSTHLSFAWEDSINQKNMMDSIGATVEDTQEVVVIGYSFPYFNREIDRHIFKMMPHLNKVYIQDINPSAVIQSIEAVLPIGANIRPIPIVDCTQFYLPAEL